MPKHETENKPLIDKKDKKDKKEKKPKKESRFDRWMRRHARRLMFALAC